MTKLLASLTIAGLLAFAGPAFSQTTPDAPVVTQDGADNVADADDEGFDLGWLGLLGLIGLAGLSGRKRHDHDHTVGTTTRRP